MLSVPRGRRRKKPANSQWNRREGDSVRHRSSANGVDDVGSFHYNDEVDAFLTRLDDDIEEPAQKSTNNRKRKSRETNSNHNHTISTRSKTGDGSVIAHQQLLHLREIGMFGQTASRKWMIGKLPVGRGCKTSWKTLALCKPAPTLSATSFSENDSIRSSCGSVPIYNMHNFSSTQNHNTSASCDTDTSGIGSVQLHKLVWRTKQIIPFSKMRTPTCDAILAVDRSGGYLIGVGGEDSLMRRRDESQESHRPRLSLKFYGVPSPGRLHQCQQYATRQCLVSPLVHTVPLLLERSGRSEDRDLLSFGDHASPTAETPLRILLSDDETMGVAFLCHSTETSSELQDEENLGTIVIFEMPSIINRDNGNALTKSYRCCNVRIGGWNSFTMRNSLWPTNIIPVRERNWHDPPKQGGGVLCDSFRKTLSAHIFFNDEDDGFRLTWASIGAMMTPACQTSTTMQSHSPCGTQPSRKDIVTFPEEDVWETCVSQSATSQCYKDSYLSDRTGLELAFQVYLRVDALLSDILERRKQSSLFAKSPYQSQHVCFMPDFCYNLVSVAADRVELILVLVFSNKEKLMHAKKVVPSALGVFVKLNLYDQSYDELTWVSWLGANDVDSMKSWCKSLALNWRMRECRVGIFCTDTLISDSFPNWVCGTHEYNCNEDLTDDIYVSLWTEYAKKKKVADRTKSQILAPKAVSMSSLYPSCDVVSNSAVLSAIPLTRMKSRNSPIEVVYG